MSVSTLVSAACTVTFIAARTVARAVTHRDGDRPDAGREFLVGERPAAGPHRHQFGVDVGAVARQEAAAAPTGSARPAPR